MDALTKIDSQIRVAVEKKKKLITDILDGRTQRWLSDKTGIEETRISRWINGGFILEEWEVEKIESTLTLLTG